MSQLRPLLEVEGIWQRRTERAEELLRQAQLREQTARAALEQARVALAQYIESLPGLIEQLYADCIGYEVTPQFVQDKAFDEGKLRAHVAELRAEVSDAEKELEAASEGVREAQRVLNKERVKLEAMQDLIKEEKIKIAVAEGRTLAKTLDDLSGSKYARQMRETL
ncbi:MAG: YscO family type III secretion system apparatus protein [Gammaproteobacteria bacterium]